MSGRNVSGEIVLVTGASRGLGFEVAKALGAAGAQVVAVARTVGGLEALDDAIRAAGGPNALLTPLDLAEPEAIDALGGALYERYGRLDGLVHAAAEGAALAPAAHLEPKDFERLMRVNAQAVARLIRSMDPLLGLAPHPRAVFVADEKAGKPLWSGYGASKAAGAAVARSYAAEQRRVSVDLFEPNPMPTALRARSHPGDAGEGLSPPEAEAARLIAMFDALGATRAET